MGTVFDIKEFALYDGPGVRTTAFLKGCPLRCRWCHNPEGLSVNPVLMVSVSACLHCGKCKTVCDHTDFCTACGKCVPYCPGGLRRIAGTEMSPDELADKLKKSAVFEGGGVTFSGGEPMLQWPFVKETIGRLKNIHTAIETSGYCSDDHYADMLSSVDLIIMDIKLVDSKKHKEWTGVDNAPILKHLEMLKNSGKPFIIRIPLIPTVNDTDENLQATAELLAGAENLIRVELLPYHTTAGAKYEMAHMAYHPGFDESVIPNKNTKPFEEKGINCLVMFQA